MSRPIVADLNLAIDARWLQVAASCGEHPMLLTQWALPKEFRRAYMLFAMPTPPNESDERQRVDELLDSIDYRPLHTQRTLAALRKYCELSEAQLDEVQRIERVELDREHPRNAEEEELRDFWRRQDYLEEVYEKDIRPTMRYSFVVFAHILFETELRRFCITTQRERNLRVALSDLRGSAIDQGRAFLTKLAGISVGDWPEWSEMRKLQMVRDCAVHAFGYVEESRDEKSLRELASKDVGLSINEDNRLVLTKKFCDACFGSLEAFFYRLFKAAGWRI